MFLKVEIIVLTNYELFSKKRQSYAPIQENIDIYDIGKGLESCFSDLKICLLKLFLADLSS